jgi:hypothetical protein
MKPLVLVLVLSATAVGCASAPAPRPVAPAPAASSPVAPAPAASGPAAPAPPISSPAPRAAPDEGLARLSTEDLVRKVLELTGASRLGKQVAEGMVDNLHKMPNLPPGFLDRFQDNIHTGELTDLMVPIYLKHYDRETLLAAIAFYESDHGKALIKELPAVTAESMEIGRTWGTSIANRTLHDLGLTAPPKP